MRDLAPRVKAGDATARHLMACLYLCGRGVRFATEMAVDLLGGAANAGYAPAQLLAGLLCLDGAVVQRDQEQAFVWLRQSAEQMDIVALRRLLACFTLGEGVARTPILAYTCARLLAKHGDANASVLCKTLGAGLADDEKQLAEYVTQLRPICLDPVELRIPEVLRSMRSVELAPNAKPGVASPSDAEASNPSAWALLGAVAAGFMAGQATRPRENDGKREYALACAKCGVEPGHSIGSNNWQVCSVCQMALCSNCSTMSFNCTRHQPWGTWLRGDGCYAGIRLTDGRVVGVRLTD